MEVRSGAGLLARLGLPLLAGRAVLRGGRAALPGQDPHTVALEWMLAEGFVKD
ncbi:hypothetical protein ACWEP3_19475 [Streptomyces albidoflavus]